MIRIVCPSCNKDSYTSSVETFRPCPYCGNPFSGKYGTEKRFEQRIQKTIPFTFSYKGDNIPAITRNLSENGIGIKISGKPSIPAGDAINLKIGKSNAKAHIIWISYNNDSSKAGLRILDGSFSLDTLRSCRREVH